MNGEFRRNIAIIIGIEDYSSGIDRLQTPVNDAQHLATILETQHHYAPTLLTKGVTKERLTALFCAELPQTISANDRLLVYFAGHGIAIEAQDGPEGYLLPQDARLLSPTTYLAMTDLYCWLANLPCRHILLILDCCFAGAMRWSSTRHVRLGASVLYRERFERFTKEPAYQILTSSAHDQYALDSIRGISSDLRGMQRVDGRHHSPFALALFAALRGAADIMPPGKGDGVITATELYLYLRDTVEQEAAKHKNHQQTPGLWSAPRSVQGKYQHYDRGEYVFLVPGHAELNLPAALPLRMEQNPYLGLHTYTEESAKLFFGRSELITQLYNYVIDHPLTVVLGPSGIGKSSLVLAGLIPKLQKAKDYHILPPLRPANAADHPFTYLLQFLTERLGSPTAAATTPVEIVTHWFQSHPEQQLVLVIDQLEELITVCRNEHETEAFLTLLDQILSSHPKLFHLVCTLRSDFEPAFDRRWSSRWWSDGRFIVPPMQADDLRQVIEEPAIVRVLHFEPPELVDELIREVIDSPGALPLLSFTLSELYRLYVRSQREDRALTQTDYEQLGRVYGALRQRADEEYQRMPDRAHQQTMIRIMLRMVSIEGGELSRRRVRKTELEYPSSEENARVEEVLKRLTDARLLVSGSTEIAGKRIAYVEPAHDTLVRTWGYVGGGQHLSEDDLLLQRQLTQAADAWQQEESTRNVRLLWNNSPRLPQLQRIIQSDRSTQQDERRFFSWMRQTLWPATTPTNPNPTWLNRVETQFVLASIMQRRNRWRQLIGWVVLAFMTISITAMIALVQRNEAQRQEEEALRQLAISESQRLAQMVEDIRASQPEQGLTLAYEAGSRNDNALSRQALWDSLAAMPLPSISYGDGTDQQVESVALSPDGNALLLTPVRNTPNANSAILWDLRNTRTISLTVDADLIYSARFSPDSQKIVTTDNDGWARIWNLQGQQITAFPPFTVGMALYQDAYFIADDQILVLDSDYGAHIFAIGQPTPITSFLGHQQRIWAVAASSDQQHLLTSGRDGVAILWDLRGQQIATIAPSSADSLAYSYAWQAVFSPDGQHILTPAPDGVARLWDLTGREVMRFSGYTSPIRYICFSPDGQSILTSAEDGMVRLWDLTGKELQSFAHDSLAVTAIFSPDGQQILTAAGQWLRLWTLDGRILHAWNAHAQDIETAVFSSETDLHRIVSWGRDGRARLWDLSYLSAMQLPRAGEFVFSPQRQQVLAINSDTSASLINLADHASISLLHPISNAIFSADGRYLLSHADGEPVRLWTTDGQLHANLDLQSEAVLSMALSPDGQTILTTTGKTAQLWHADASLSATLSHPTGNITLVALDPHGQMALTAGDDAVPLLWNMQGELIAKLIGHTNSIAHASFSPNGQYILTTANDATARLWSREGHLLQTFAFEGQDFSPVLNAQFSPDSDRVLVWYSPEQTTQQSLKAKIWSIDGQLISDLSGRAGMIRSATFSSSQPCGATQPDPLAPYLLTTSTDGSIRLWSTTGTQIMQITAAVQEKPLTTLDTIDLLLNQGNDLNAINQAIFDQQACHILTLSNQSILTQSVYRMSDMLSSAACRIGRDLTQQEIIDYGLISNRRFVFSNRHCPPEINPSALVK
ncbi:Peptidase C14, caspase catalytic subunit p20 [Oscillochloris trichoides DG-6]|uniref:Peptidase C14, caspase catalytic subunit p20 n=1 Tax=Oscillochloris trichoides DG-6 TaxID=765420 RepID=E1IFL5_9CHLR|nr:caspase family protein [Oscillochloris trichoides]EFO80031.1 Peptidase C14, caspase catalytic subunit p20 [Oscillochloris trichoides DG-6]